MIDKLKKRFDDANNNLSNRYKSAPLGMNYNELDLYLKPYYDKLDFASREYRLHKVPSFKNIPKYGIKMNLIEFVEICNVGGFIDYDGSGNYVKDDMMSDISIYPSDVLSGLRTDFDEIIWFNR